MRDPLHKEVLFGDHPHLHSPHLWKLVSSYDVNMTSAKALQNVHEHGSSYEWHQDDPLNPYKTHEA